MKPSVIRKLAEGLSSQGIDISNIVALSEYLSDDAAVQMLENTDYKTLPPDLIERLAPLLDLESRMVIFDKVLTGEADRKVLCFLGLPYTYIENAVIEGYLPWSELQEYASYARTVWKCPKCGKRFALPRCECGYTVHQKQCVWQFSGDVPAKAAAERAHPLRRAECLPTKTETAAARMVAALVGGGQLLELGAGDGALTVPLGAEGLNLFAADTDPAALERIDERFIAYQKQTGKQLPLKTEYCLLDGKAIPSADGVFDAILPEMPDADPAICREVLRALKPGGTVIRIGNPDTAADRFFSSAAKETDTDTVPGTELTITAYTF